MDEQNIDTNGSEIEAVKEERYRIMNDMKHPYNDPKATMRAHGLAVKYVNTLSEIIAGKRTSISGYVEEYDNELKEAVKKERGAGWFENKHAASGERSGEGYSFVTPDLSVDAGSRQSDQSTPRLTQ